MANENIYVSVEEISEWTGSLVTINKTYQRVNFSDFEIHLYNEKDIALADDFYPTEINYALYFYDIENMELTRPSFIGTKEWNNLKRTSSGFMTSHETIMPRIVFPSAQLSNNGFAENGYNKTSTNEHAVDYDKYGDTFNWITTDNTDKSELSGYGKRNELKEGERYGYIDLLTTKNTTDEDVDKERKYRLENPTVVPAPTEDFSTTLIGQGKGGAACAFCFNMRKAIKRIDEGDENTIVDLPNAFIAMNEVEFTVNYLGKLEVNINDQKTSGSLAKSQSAHNPGQSRAMQGDNTYVLLVFPVWNGVVCSSGFQDKKDLVKTASLYAIKNNKANINEYCDPKLEDYDFDNPSPVILEYLDDVRADWGTQIDLTLTDTICDFSYTPAFFVKKCRFDIFFKGPLSDSEGAYTYEYRAYPVYSKNGVDGEVDIINFSNKAEEIADSKNVDDLTVYRKYEFEMFSNVDEWQRRGLEAWGYIQQTRETTTPRIDNNHGSFSLNKGDGAVDLQDWWNYLQSVSISRSMEGTGGNFVLDKYAFVDQLAEPPQNIGGLKFNIEGGSSTMTPGHIFSGIAMEIADNVSESGDTWSVSLYGLEKKLEDIRLINAPFWDGDSVGSVADWLGNYGGIQVSFAHGNYGRALPRSRDFEAPAVNFTMGTPVIEALRTIAEWSAHEFIIQKDGVGYFYSVNEYGIPYRCYNSPIHIYDGTVASSRSNTPEFSNLYNTFFTVGLLVNELGERDPLLNDVVPGTRFDKVTSNPSVPWSKVIVNSESGALTKEELEEHHRTNLHIGRSYMTTGSISIPGKADIDILDRISVDGVEWYIYEVSHDINLQTKTWQTNLAVAKVI